MFLGISSYPFSVSLSLPLFFFPSLSLHRSFIPTNGTRLALFRSMERAHRGKSQSGEKVWISGPRKRTTMPVLASHNEPLNPQCSHCICTNGSERASPLLSRATPNPFSSAQSYRKESRMPGCSRKHIFHPHNIYSSAGLYRFKAGAPNETENPLSRRDPWDPVYQLHQGRTKFLWSSKRCPIG